jgi:hypothetical protein
MEDCMIYGRNNPNVCFLLPTIAIGVDIDGRYFLEAGWLFWAIGLGDK